MAIRFYDGTGTEQIKTSQLKDAMQELGADWDPDELEEAERALDPFGKGLVSFEDFKVWWMN